MNIGFFGGTFDPIHHGHIAVAQAAMKRFRLGKILFVPSNAPPHKQKQPLTEFVHRYAMICLALAEAGQKNFFPSLLEAPSGSEKTHYSIGTVSRLKRSLKKADKLFFLIGIDAFLDLAKWRQPEALLQECEFIVASRAGYSLSDVAAALPASLRPSQKILRTFKRQPARGELALPGVTIHLLEGVNVPVSATRIRAAAARGRKLSRMVPSSVADYISKTRLYQPASKKESES